VSLKAKLALIEALPRIIAESVKPMEHIESLKILDVRGLERFGAGGGSPGQGSGNGGSGNLGQDLVNAALSYRAQLPILDNLLSELGVKDGKIQDLLNQAGATSTSVETEGGPASGKAGD